MTPEDAEQMAKRALAQAREASEAGDFVSAVLSYKDALDLDPRNSTAAAELREATEAEQAMAPIRLAFQNSDYRSALWLLYRVGTVPRMIPLDRYRAAAWYNLGLVDLRAGRCEEALQDLKEVLAIRPEDGGARGTFELARECRKRSSQLSFRYQVEALAFRTMQE
jgi:predicted TPR repeat methyltransferase